MRESIGKYRGKVKTSFDGYYKKGDWIYGNLIKTPNMSFIVTGFGYSGCVIDGVESIEVDPNTVGELWIHNKDNKPFYEGDIIESPNKDNSHIIRYDEEEGKFVAEFVPYCDFNPSCELSKRWIDDFDKIVIGTIYDKEKS